MLFRDLSTEAKIVYHVIRRIKNHKTDEFFHSVKKIADVAGISERWCQYALSDLVDKGILQRTERTGHTSLYKLIQTVQLSDPRTICTPHPNTMHPTPAQYAPITTSALTNSDLTTTSWLSGKLRDKLVKQFGQEAVNDRVVVISKMNGNVKNKAGLLVDSLRRGYIPTSKEFREKEDREKYNKWLDEQIEKDRADRKQMEKDFEENYDPEVGKSAISQFLEKIGEIRQ